MFHNDRELALIGSLTHELMPKDARFMCLNESSGWLSRITDEFKRARKILQSPKTVRDGFLIQMDPEIIKKDFVFLKVRRPNVWPTFRLLLDRPEQASRLRHDVRILMAGERRRLAAEYFCRLCAVTSFLHILK